MDEKKKVYKEIKQTNERKKITSGENICLISNFRTTRSEDREKRFEIGKEKDGGRNKQ